MIDLHMHTNYSDGTDSLEELLLKGEFKKLEIISITDHDDISAYQELTSKPSLRKTFSGIIIPGVELKSAYEGIPIEILAYGIDYKKLRIHKINQEQLQINTLKELTNKIKMLGFKYDKNNLYIDKEDPLKHWASTVIANEILSYKENKELIKKYGNFTSENFYRMHISNKNSVFYYNETQDYLSLKKLLREFMKREV